MSQKTEFSMSGENSGKTHFKQAPTLNNHPHSWILRTQMVALWTTQKTLDQTNMKYIQGRNHYF